MAHPPFLATSRVMRGLIEQVRMFAATDGNVFISGETGSGKNAVARELHARGPRARQPFVTIDCAGLAATLVDSELFGHERGAYTDAVTARPGRFELAAGGTVYLDAVSELPLESQGKLLRIVEDKRVERLGSHTPLAVTARIVSSADARIEDAVRAAQFRHDLYHRLRVLPLFIPPLREHKDDVLPLARLFLKKLVRATGRERPTLTRDAGVALTDYAWPGNVRELKHVIERAVTAAEGGPVGLDHLPPGILTAAAPTPEAAPRRWPTLEEVERRHVAAALQHVRGNQTEAARLLGISRKALWEKRKRYGLD